MAELTKKEIQAQLKKLGIHSSSELRTYSQEYKEYSAHQHPLVHASRENQKTEEIYQQDQYLLSRKFVRTCRALFPVLGNFFTQARVRTYKK
jgi:arsenate reductase-like glutaredoxin family protein